MIARSCDSSLSKCPDEVGFGEFRLSWEQRAEAEVKSCKRSHARLQLLSPKGQILGWKEYTPCVLVRFYSGIPHITSQHTVTQQALKTAGCWGPLAAMCWALSPLYGPEAQKHAIIDGNWSPTTVSSLSFLPTYSMYNMFETVRQKPHMISFATLKQL